MAVSENTNKHQRHVFGRIWEVWFWVVQAELCGVINHMKHELHGDAPERSLQMSDEKYNIRCISPTVRHRGWVGTVWGVF